jgi:hypothetical protein
MTNKRRVIKRGLVIMGKKDYGRNNVDMSKLLNVSKLRGVMKTTVFNRKK